MHRTAASVSELSVGLAFNHLPPRPASPSLALDAIYEFVRVGVKDHPPLLHQHADVALEGVEEEPRVVALHLSK
jgi:hypothetical protein